MSSFERDARRAAAADRPDALRASRSAWRGRSCSRSARARPSRAVHAVDAAVNASPPACQRAFFFARHDFEVAARRARPPAIRARAARAARVRVRPCARRAPRARARALSRRRLLPLVDGSRRVHPRRHGIEPRFRAQRAPQFRHQCMQQIAAIARIEAVRGRFEALRAQGDGARRRETDRPPGRRARACRRARPLLRKRRRDAVGDTFRARAPRAARRGSAGIAAVSTSPARHRAISALGASSRSCSRSGCDNTTSSAACSQPSVMRRSSASAVSAAASGMPAFFCNATGMKRVRARRERPRVVGQAADPQMVEFEAGGFEYAQHLHRRIVRLRLKQRVGAQAAQACERLRAAHARQHAFEPREFAEHFVPFGARLEFVRVERRARPGKPAASSSAEKCRAHACGELHARKIRAARSCRALRTARATAGMLRSRRRVRASVTRAGSARATPHRGARGARIRFRRRR